MSAATCPDCGRTLAGGARRCVYCGQGTQVQRREELAVPPREDRPARRGPFPWKRLAVLALLAAAAAAALRHPAVAAKLREWLPR